MCRTRKKMLKVTSSSCFASPSYPVSFTAFYKKKHFLSPSSHNSKRLYMPTAFAYIQPFLSLTQLVSFLLASSFLNILRSSRFRSRPITFSLPVYVRSDRLDNLRNHPSTLPRAACFDTNLVEEFNLIQKASVF